MVSVAPDGTGTRVLYALAAGAQAAQFTFTDAKTVYFVSDLDPLGREDLFRSTLP